MALFDFRRRIWGNWKLRPGLPQVSETPTLVAERNFYSLVLARVLVQVPMLVPEAVDGVWDVGCRSWSYAAALAARFPRARLEGIELDAQRRYWTLHRQMDLAQAFVLDLQRRGRTVSCRVGDFRAEDVRATLGWGETVVFCFFFPFVSPGPCERWGLPTRYADFASLLKHALDEATAAGARATILSCHQGDWEVELAAEAYARVGVGAALSPSLIEPSEFSGLWPSPHAVGVIGIHCS